MLYLLKKMRSIKGKIYNHFLAKKLPGAENINIHPSAQLFGLGSMTIGKNFMAGEHLRMEAISRYGPVLYNPRIVIKDNVCLNDFVHIGAVSYIEIGNNVLMASKIYISDHNHGSYSGEDQSSPETPPGMRVIGSSKQVIIGDNVWIGEFVSILPGVTIGAGSIIGANSVVSRSIPPSSIAVGCPARVVKSYDHAQAKWVSA